MEGDLGLPAGGASTGGPSPKELAWGTQPGGPNPGDPARGTQPEHPAKDQG